MNEDLRKELPKEIYLTDGDEDESLVWCEDMVTDEDVKYIRADVLETAITKARKDAFKEIDPFDLVQECKPDCTPEEHAYHQGTWDSYLKLEKILELLTQDKEKG